MNRTLVRFWWTRHRMAMGLDLRCFSTVHDLRLSRSQRICGRQLDFPPRLPQSPAHAGRACAGWGRVVTSRAELEELYKTHRPMAVRRARSILGDIEAANDVAQEVFLDLFARPDQFQGRSKFTTFLYAAVTNRCLQRLRDSKNRTRLLEAEGALTSEAHAGGAERVVLLRQILGRLPPELAEVGVYFYVDSMTYDQIAETLSCSRRHVAELLARFRDASEVLVRESAS